MGATTIDEHRKYIERDAALERRFQPVYVDEPSEAQTLEILKVRRALGCRWRPRGEAACTLGRCCSSRWETGAMWVLRELGGAQGLKERYERHHRVVYSEEAMSSAVKLSHKYIADRCAGAALGVCGGEGPSASGRVPSSEGGSACIRRGMWRVAWRCCAGSCRTRRLTCWTRRARACASRPTWRASACRCGAAQRRHHRRLAASTARPSRCRLHTEVACGACA